LGAQRYLEFEAVVPGSVPFRVALGDVCKSPALAAIFHRTLLDVLKERAVKGDRRYYLASDVDVTDRRHFSKRTPPRYDPATGGEIFKIMSVGNDQFQLGLKLASGERVVSPLLWTSDEITASNAALGAGDYAYLAAALGAPHTWCNLIGSATACVVSTSSADGVPAVVDRERDDDVKSIAEECIGPLGVAAAKADAVALVAGSEAALGLARRNPPSDVNCVKSALQADGALSEEARSALDDLPNFVGSITRPSEHVASIFKAAGLHLRKPRVEACTLKGLLAAEPGKFILLGCEKKHAIFLNTLHNPPYVVSNDVESSVPLQATAAVMARLGCKDVALARRITWVTARGKGGKGGRGRKRRKPC